MAMQNELSKKELVALLDEAQKELEKAKNNLDEAFKELNEMYKENYRALKNLNMAKYIIANLTNRNTELEKENKLLKEFMLND